MKQFNRRKIMRIKCNQMIKKIALAAMILLTITSTAFSVPMNLSYQGFILDNNGQPINSTVNIMFNLYVTEVDNQSIWAETHNDVIVSDGIFNVILGIEAPLKHEFFKDDLYLGISIDGSSEMQPRRKFTSTAFAIRAGVADAVDGSNIDDHSIDLTKLNFADQDGNIEIPGNIKAGSFMGDASQLSGVVKEEFDPVWKTESSNYWTKDELKRVSSREFSGAFSIGVFDSFLNSNSSNLQDVLDDLDVAISNKDASPWSKDGNNYYYQGGNIGIGTNTPSATLDVNGSMIRKIYHSSGNTNDNHSNGEYVTSDFFDDGYQVQSRVLKFTKAQDDTNIRIGYTDVLTVYCESSSCDAFWEIKIDGESCAEEPLVYGYSVYNLEKKTHIYRARNLIGYCKGIEKGEHEVQVWIVKMNVYYGSKGKCVTGFKDSRWTLEAEETY
jgi:hypothetical protein